MNLIPNRTLVPWSAFERLGAWRDLLDSAFAGSDYGATRSWLPPLDVREDDDKVIVTVELAGMKREDFDISIENDVLKISGKRTVANEAQRGESFRRERFVGSFSRSVTLLAPVKTQDVGATYQDGILCITLPKEEAARPRKIEVKLN